MEPRRHQNYQVCRRLDFSDDDNSEDQNKNITNETIKEETEKTKSEFATKYNFDVDNETPLPGKYEYRLENGTWIGKLTANTREDGNNKEDIGEEDEPNGKPVNKRDKNDSGNDDKNTKKETPEQGESPPSNA